MCVCVCVKERGRERERVYDDHLPRKKQYQERKLTNVRISVRTTVVTTKPTKK